MDQAPDLFTTEKYRCLVYPHRQLEELSLLMCGVENCLPGYEFHTDGREGYHLHVILRGKGLLSVKGRELNLHAGQMFITKPEEDTWYRANESDPWVYCWMTYDGTRARKYTEAAGFSDQVNALDCQISLMRFYTLVRLTLDHPAMDLSGDLFRLGSLMEYLSLAIESAYLGGASQRRTQEYNSSVYVEYALRCFEADFATIKVSDVARQIGINRSYFTTIFKSRVGVSPQEYLMHCRMKHACSMLVGSELAVLDIAERVGYENALTFSRIFKSYYGLSPTSYRLNHRQDGEKPGEQKEESTS